MCRLLVATVFVAALLTLPGVALAMHAPGDGPAAAPTSVPVDYLADGKYPPHPAAVSSRGLVQIVRVVKPVGFHVRDAAIGAGLGALLVGALFGALTLVWNSRGSSAIEAGPVN